ncbi:MAG: hypothetical protein K2Y29_09535 [Beijerinckiaceae bacterium]|nr:hypothetical protein [Beijerinckiaceae bacterium]
MKDQDWLAANSGDGLEIAQRYLTEAKAAQNPIEAIERYLHAIEVMQAHLGRMDTQSAFVRASVLREETTQSALA